MSTFKKRIFQSSTPRAKIIPFSPSSLLFSAQQMERENIYYRLQSGKANYLAKGGRLGRKPGYRKSRETKKKSMNPL